MRRIKNKVTRGKLLMIAESIFNSKIRYAIALYLNPIIDREDIKTRKLSQDAYKLQVIQNKMLRMIFEYKLQDQVNMEKLREKIQMISVNQMSIYHTLIEAFNVIHYGSADRIQAKWITNKERVYSNRRSHDVKIPRVEHITCQGFSLHGAKAWNSLPECIKSIKNPDIFKQKI